MPTTVSWIIGVQIFTTHLGAVEPDMGVEVKRSLPTPGIYAIAPSGLTFGSYRNSIGRASVYGGWTFRTGGDFGPLKDVSFTLAGVTGYREIPVLPLVGISAKLGGFPGAPRLIFVPLDSAPLTVAWEW